MADRVSVVPLVHHRSCCAQPRSAAHSRRICSSFLKSSQTRSHCCVFQSGGDLREISPKQFCMQNAYLLGSWPLEGAQKAIAVTIKIEIIPVRAIILVICPHHQWLQRCGTSVTHRGNSMLRRPGRRTFKKSCLYGSGRPHLEAPSARCATPFLDNFAYIAGARPLLSRAYARCSPTSGNVAALQRLVEVGQEPTY